MLRKALACSLCFLVLGLAEARAHFIWIDVKPAKTDGGQAQVYFGELPEPGEPHLLSKIAPTKCWVRVADGASVDLKLAADADAAALVSNCQNKSAASIEATCDYGVYERGPGVLLQYYAKRLSGDWSEHAAKLARAERLALDIVPNAPGKELGMLVLYQGKPAKASEVIVIDPAGDSHDLKTDDQGRVTTPCKPGRYAIRAAHIEPERSGERNGKAYKQTWHYATLVLDVPASKGAKSDEPTAATTLKRSRDARAIWSKFPGFTSELAVHDGNQEVPGKVTIDGSGTVSLEMPKGKLADWVEEQMQTLVQHRMPDGEVSEGEVKWADSDLTHPLGRKIDLDDPSNESVYRVRDDVITEVNRSMGPMRFTISVLEITRNAENKYLPRSFTMNFFDSASGELKTSLAYWNDWQRVGAFDLPKTILEISTRKAPVVTRQIEFKNCQLLK